MANFQQAIQWSTSPGTVGTSVTRRADSTQARLLATAAKWAYLIAEDARATHRWTNRTGDAERGIWGEAGQSGDAVIVKVGHGVFYGVFLERRWAGKYAGVEPAIQRNASAFFAECAQVVTQ